MKNATCRSSAPSIGISSMPAGGAPPIRASYAPRARRRWAMPLGGQADDDGQPAPLDVGVEIGEKAVLLSCGDERVDEHGRVIRFVVHAADLARPRS